MLKKLQAFPILPDPFVSVVPVQEPSINYTSLEEKKRQFPEHPQLAKRIYDRANSLLARYSRVKVFAFIALKNDRIKYGFYEVDNFGMIHDKALKKSFDVAKIYNINSYPTVFCYEEMRPSVDFRQKEESIDVIIDAVAKEGKTIALDKYKALIKFNDELSIDPTVAWNKMNNKDIREIIQAQTNGDIMLYAVVAGAACSVIVLMALFNVISAPALSSIGSQLNSIIEYVKPVVIK